MRVWFDADNGPHVLIMRPLAQELARQGHEVRFTARDRTSTCELLDSFEIPYLKVGGAYADGFVGKSVGTVGRALSLVRAMRGWEPEVSYGHGSRALPIASRMMSVPTVTMFDYEWTNAAIFNRFCQKILLPDRITPQRCCEAGIKVEKVRFYHGLKEELYLPDAVMDPSVSDDLGLCGDRIRVLLRPPATTAHYHNPEAEKLLEKILELLLPREDVQIVVVTRTPDQRGLVPDTGKAEVIFPDRVYDGPSLIQSMDLVIGGGGTMTREAAILGVPSYSFFRGREGQVDGWLEQQDRLVMLRSVAEVGSKLRVAKAGKPEELGVHPGLVGDIVREILIQGST